MKQQDKADIIDGVKWFLIFLGKILVIVLAVFAALVFVAFLFPGYDIACLDAIGTIYCTSIDMSLVQDNSSFIRDNRFFCKDLNFDEDRYGYDRYQKVYYLDNEMLECKNKEPLSFKGVLG